MRKTCFACKIKQFGKFKEKYLRFSEYWLNFAKNMNKKKDMRRFILSAFVFTASIIAICSCNGKSGSARNVLDSLSFDSVKVDTTVHLSKDTADPRCHIKLSLTYAKGNKADVINDSLIRTGVLSPDFFSFTDRRTTVQEAVDSFVARYISDYKKFYGELYNADKENSPSYYCEYLLNSHINTDNPDYYTYIANVYSYMGGAHGSSTVIARNISTKTGKIVTLKDIFVPGYDKGLQDAIAKVLCEKNDVKDLKSLSEKTTIFDGIDVYASNNFIIGKKGITFIYSPDEIASHAAGEIRVEVDNSDIESLFKK